MKLILEGEPKEIVSLILEMQGRRDGSSIYLPLNEELLVSSGLENGLKGE